MTDKEIKEAVEKLKSVNDILIKEVKVILELAEQYLSVKGMPDKLSDSSNASLIGKALTKGFNTALNECKLAVVKERNEFEEIYHEVSKVYYHITNGKLSKPNYQAEVLIAEFDDMLSNEYVNVDDIEIDYVHKDKLPSADRLYQIILNWQEYFEREHGRRIEILQTDRKELAKTIIKEIDNAKIS